MGLHQRTETGGLISLLVGALLAWIAMTLCTLLLPASWLISRRRFLIVSIIIATCGMVSFIVGYSRRSESLSSRHTWYVVLRRLAEILALAAVYASTLFLVSFAALNGASLLMGTVFLDYLTAVCAALAGLASYVTFIQAELMDAKTLASLLPIFVIAGVSVAGLTTDDPNWSSNNFSQLGDRTTFAARMFNSTLVLAGTCVIIVSYFAISELVATYRVRRDSNESQGPNHSNLIKHYKLRLALLSTMLTISGVAFIGVGLFRYTPHPILHNVAARGLTVVIALLLLALPWLAPQLSRATYFISYVALVVCCVVLAQWMLGMNTMTNVEATAGLIFLGWFIVFSRQIAAIEADRIMLRIANATSRNASEEFEPTGHPSHSASRLSATR